MRVGAVAVLLLGLGACGSQTAHGAPGSGPASNWSPVLRHNMIAAGATLDGALVTDLRETAPCTGVITTGQVSTAVKWRDLGNMAPTKTHGRINFDIPAGGRVHVLSAREGPVGTRIDMGLGLLDDQCGGA